MSSVFGVNTLWFVLKLWPSQHALTASLKDHMQSITLLPQYNPLSGKLIENCHLL